MAGICPQPLSPGQGGPGLCTDLVTYKAQGPVPVGFAQLRAAMGREEAQLGLAVGGHLGAPCLKGDSPVSKKKTRVLISKQAT